MNVTLHLPVKRFVFKYCDTLFCENTNFGPSWRLNLRSKEAKFFYALLERTPDRYEKYEPSDEELRVLLPWKIVSARGCYISPANLELFNEYIHQAIIDEIQQFHTGIKTRIGLKMIDKVTVNQYQANNKIRVLRVASSEAEKFYWQKSIITDILAKYDITEDEISSDSVVKHLQRHVPARKRA